MKKLVSAMLAVLLVVTSLSSVVFADTDTAEMESILSAVKERVTVPANLTEFSSHQSTMYGTTIYTFTWESNDEEDYGSMSVSCNTKGVLTSYESYGAMRGGYESELSIPKVSANEAKQKAVDYIRQLNPDVADQIRILDDNSALSLRSRPYSFQIVRTANGIPVMDNNGYLTVDSNTGELLSFNLDWTPGVEFPSPEGAISLEDAKNAFSDKLGLKLIYDCTYEKDGVTAYPVYVLNQDSSNYINALTGEVVTKNNIYAYRDAVATSGGGGSNETAKAMDFTPEELAEIEKVAGLLSKEEAEAVTRGNSYANPGDLPLSSCTLRKSSINADEYTYSLYFRQEDANAWVSMDAKTGEILGFSKYDTSRDYTKEIDPAKAREVAQTVLNTLAGDKAPQYKVYMAEEGGYVTFTRIVNGIEFPSNMATVSVNSDYAVDSYSISYYDIEFPSITGVLDSKAASMRYLEENYGLQYVINYNDNAVEGVYLTYAQDNTYAHLDPFKGVQLDYAGKPVTESDGRKTYSDIEGHYAQMQIETLGQYGIGFDGGLFLPDDSIMQKDYIMLLTSLFCGYEPAVYNEETVTQGYKRAVGAGIITKEEQDPEAIITRETAAKYFVRGLGIAKYAELDIYNCPFPDVTTSKGYISILAGLGVVNGDETGNYNPGESLSRADAMILIYNYIQ